MRLVALLLTLALAGPSIGALVCDWTCAMAHEAAAATASNCHDAPGPAQTATFAAGHECHELSATVASIVTSAVPVVDAAVTVNTPTHETVIVQVSHGPRRPDRSHAPPPARIAPLRI